MSLFQRGNFQLHSGEWSWWKIECDELTDEDLEVLAAIIAGWYPQQFGDVLGVPRGGMRLAAALTKYRRPDHRTLLIVDDVLTTGTSMDEVAASTDRPHLGAVIFARAKPRAWIRPVFQLWATP